MLKTEGFGPHMDAGLNTMAPLHFLVLELREVLSGILPEDLSAGEVAALLDILIPAHARVIGRPSARPGLRIARSYGDQPASDLGQQRVDRSATQVPGQRCQFGNP